MSTVLEVALACAVLVVPLYAAYVAVRWIAQHSRGGGTLQDRPDSESE